MTDSDLKVVTCAEDPEFVMATQKRIGAEWPEFMLHDPIAQLLFDCYELLPEYQFIMVDTKTNEAVSLGNSIPLSFEGAPEELPDKGWDWAISKGIEDVKQGHKPHIQCALQIVVFGDNRGRGISSRAVRAMKEIGRNHGLDGMVAPVRPSRKSDHPDVSIDEYITWKRDDGFPFDPWLRVHAKLGARIVKPCPLAMTIKGTVAEWAEWTGLEFPESGDYVIPGALLRVKIDLEHDTGTYLEPNVWMHHPGD